MNKDILNQGLKIVRSIRELNDHREGINIEAATIFIGDDKFDIKKASGKQYEYKVHLNGEFVRCSEDNTLCYNDGRCLHCGYCL